MAARKREEDAYQQTQTEKQRMERLLQEQHTSKQEEVSPSPLLTTDVVQKEIVPKLAPSSPSVSQQWMFFVVLY